MAFSEIRSREVRFAVSDGFPSLHTNTGLITKTNDNCLMSAACGICNRAPQRGCLAVVPMLVVNDGHVFWQHLCEVNAPRNNDHLIEASRPCRVDGMTHNRLSSHFGEELVALAQKT